MSTNDTPALYTLLSPCLFSFLTHNDSFDLSAPSGTLLLVKDRCIFIQLVSDVWRHKKGDWVETNNTMSFFESLLEDKRIKKVED